MRGREPHVIYHSARKCLEEAVGISPPVSRGAMRFATERVRMIVKVQPITIRSILLQQPAVVLEDVVVPHVAPARVCIVIDVVHAEPVVHPPLSRAIRIARSKVVAHDPRQHCIDLVPRVVVSKQVRINHPLHCSFNAAQVESAILKLLKCCFAWLKVEMKNVAQTIESR